MTDRHKCDMFCLWEDLYATYDQCRKCKHNKDGYEYPCKNSRYEISMMDTNDHLWRKHDLDYNEYQAWLERKKKVDEIGLKMV